MSRLPIMVASWDHDRARPLPRLARIAEIGFSPFPITLSHGPTPSSPKDRLGYHFGQAVRKIRPRTCNSWLSSKESPP